jgi:hypothetical protein
MSKLKYFLSWVAIILSTLSIFIFLALLVTFTPHFDNPGGIYFYIYFIFIPLWFVLIPIYLIIATIFASWKRGTSYFVSLLTANILTGVLGVAGIFGFLYVAGMYADNKYGQELSRQRKHLSISDIQAIPQDKTATDRFNTVLVQYTLHASEDIGSIDTFVTIGTSPRAETTISNTPWIMTMDDERYNRQQTITRGNWICIVRLTQYRWDEKSLQSLKDISTTSTTTVSIDVRNDPKGDRMFDHILESTTPLSIDFRKLDLTTLNRPTLSKEASKKLSMCVKQS